MRFLDDLDSKFRWAEKAVLREFPKQLEIYLFAHPARVKLEH